MSVLRIKRLVQIVICVTVAVYTTLLVYQTISAQGYAQTPLWQERGPRSLSSRDYDSNAALPPAPPPLRYRQSSPLRAGRKPRPSHSADPFPVLPAAPVAATASTAAITTGAAQPPAALNDLFLSVKTTRSYHKWRLPVLLQTWFQLAKNQTWFFTDSDDPEFQEKTSGRMVNTNCSSSHNRKALCCKMSVEFDMFLDSGKKWFCHVDDDNYVNVPRLLRLLGNYNPQEDWYLGKPSIRAPLEILNRENPKHSKVSFWFATGGAGFCLSRALALKMMPLAGVGKFISIGEKIRLPDDVTMGYIIEHLLRKPLTVIDQFHSHLEPMKFLQQDGFHDQITFSYSRYSKDEMNVVKIDGFDKRIDPTRFLSIHCFLFPNFNFCPR